MPRNYARTPGSRHYTDYSQENLDKALQALKVHQMTQREAAKHSGISRGTPKNKLIGAHSGVIGEFLQEMRGNDSAAPAEKRRKKLDVIPDKSISTEEIAGRVN